MRGRPYYKDQPYDYDERVGALSHSEIILTSREGRRLGLESELNYMGRDLINLAYIMKPLSKAQLSVPGRQYSCVWAFAPCWEGNQAFGVRNISTFLPHVIIYVAGISVTFPFDETLHRTFALMTLC